MTAGGLWSAIAVIGLLASLVLAGFHIRRAFRERGERESRDILIGCAMAFGGLIAPIGTGLVDLPLPHWLGWALLLPFIALLGGAITMFGSSGEVGALKNRKLSRREQIFSHHDDMPYNIAALVAFTANVIVFFT